MIKKHVLIQDFLARIGRGVDLGGILGKFGILFAYILLIIVATILSPRFLSTGNLLNVIRQISIVGVLAIGQTLVILIAGIDLSVGAVLALIVVLVGDALQHYGVVPSILLGLLMGTFIGTVNGIGVAIGNLPPFVMTLGMLGIARGLAFVYTGGMPIPIVNPAFLYIGSGYFLGIPVPAIIFVVLVFIAALILRYTVFGRFIYAIGSNQEAARLCGINVNINKIFVFGLCGLMSGIAAILYGAELAVAPPIAGEGYELDAIAAVVVGGTSLMGGEGGIWGTFLGAAIIGSLSNILNLTGVSPYVQQLAKGALIIAAVAIKARGRKN
jgi:ribose/xylose/arabinose/galactoside ABC-type transport system permease subunit